MKWWLTKKEAVKWSEEVTKLNFYTDGALQTPEVLTLTGALAVHSMFVGVVSPRIGGPMRTCSWWYKIYICIVYIVYIYF